MSCRLLLLVRSPEDRAAVTGLLGRLGLAPPTDAPQVPEVPNAVLWRLDAANTPDLARAAAREMLAGSTVDWAVRPADAAPVRLLVSDMDSTLIGCECIDELAKVAGSGPKVAAITARAMAGELDFAEALRARVATLAGLPQAALEAVDRDVVRLNPGAAALGAGLKAAGIASLVVSGGFTWFAERVAARAGFDGALANTLEIADGRLTGGLLGPIVDGAAKTAALLDLTARLGVRPEAAIAIGDGANDLPMLRAAGLALAYGDREIVRAEAHGVVQSGDLAAVLALGEIAVKPE